MFMRKNDRKRKSERRDHVRLFEQSSFQDESYGRQWLAKRKNKDIPARRSGRTPATLFSFPIVNCNFLAIEIGRASCQDIHSEMYCYTEILENAFYPQVLQALESFYY
jgi:hypothetical protein